jgi:predicted HNH restriction endonuclease
VSKIRTPDEDLEMALSYREKFSSVDYIFSDKKMALKESIKDCIVVLDTNVLLIPYKLRNEDVSEINKVYETLSGNKQLFIPEHVAREFAVNKQTKLSELYKSVNDRCVKLLKTPDAAILKDLAEYSTLENEFSELTKKVDSYNKSVKDLAKRIKEWSWDDPVIQMYSKFFDGDSIINHEKDDAFIKDELSRRQKHSIAPGYKDKSKEANAAGDLNVWLSILELGKKLNKNLIFVSEDRKTDWWNQSNGSPFSPKFELINEYKIASEGKNAHFLIFSEFLEAFNAPAKVVEDVKKSEEETENLKLDFSKTKLSKKSLSRLRNYKLRHYKIQESNNTCEVCGFTCTSERSILEIHHIIPLSKGGEDTMDNLLLLCPNCHQLEHRK